MLMFVQKMKKNKLGYTLTELIVVVSILGILAVVASPFIADYVKTAKENTDATNARIIQDVILRANQTGVISGTTNSFSLSTADAAAVTSAVKGELKEGVPEVQQDSSWKFYVNTTTGFVKAEVTTGTHTGELRID